MMRSNAMMPPSPTGNPGSKPCRLCNVHADLQVSHIMPRWTYRRVTKDGDPNPIMINDSIATRGGAQLKARLLCKNCEQYVGRFDAYAATVSTQPDGRFPALETAKHLGSRSPGFVPSDISSLQTSALGRFAASVVWRTSVSQLVSSVRLGQRYEDEIASWLRDPTALSPENVIVFVELLSRADGLPLDKVCYAPLLASRSPFHTYRFVCFGMAYHVMVGKLYPPH